MNQLLFWIGELFVLAGFLFQGLFGFLVFFFLPCISAALFLLVSHRAHSLFK